MIKAKFNIDDIINGIEDELEAVIEDIVLAMQQSCLEVVTMARNLPSPSGMMRGTPHQPNYIDDTGYLRASIGYAIYRDGQLLHQDFTQLGESSSKATADEVAAQYRDGIVAVIVAGADYAAAVESKGYDVISGSSMQLKDIFQGYIEMVKQVHGL